MKIMNYLSQVIDAAKRGETIPTEPKWNKWVHRNLSPFHCFVCLKLHNCWFAKNATPEYPHHEKCHCLLVDIPYVNVMFNAVANSPYSKFDPYLFNTEGKYTHSKEVLFKGWGYTATDAKWLQSEIEKQGLEKYINGDYSLGKLDGFGQRITIRVEIPDRKSGGTVSFVTGWMVGPDGQITLNTPYGGK
jgi:hypothetical protein